MYAIQKQFWGTLQKEYMAISFFHENVISHRHAPIFSSWHFIGTTSSIYIFTAPPPYTIIFEPSVEWTWSGHFPFMQHIHY